MGNKAKGRLFRRKDGKYLLYVPKDLGEDSMFPSKATPANPEVRVKISFKIRDNKLNVEKWKENNEAWPSIQHNVSLHCLMVYK